jgi:hypothetical protein
MAGTDIDQKNNDELGQLVVVMGNLIDDGVRSNCQRVV